MFRKLRADEIDCRVSSVSQYGVGLLLYKDARCDQNILDETVGPMNWQRSHLRDNANCVVSIWDNNKSMWISKEDTGKESYTEKEKGLASDSFKRACFNWGIGRELYTAPQMFVFARDLKTLKETNGKWTCKDYFAILEIQYVGDTIVYVKIANVKNGNKIIEFGTPAEDISRESDVKNSKISKVKVDSLKLDCKSKGIAEDKLLQIYKADTLEDLTEAQFANISSHWEDIKNKVV